MAFSRSRRNRPSANLAAMMSTPNDNRDCLISPDVPITLPVHSNAGSNSPSRIILLFSGYSSRARIKNCATPHCRASGLPMVVGNNHGFQTERHSGTGCQFVLPKTRCGASDRPHPGHMSGPPTPKSRSRDQSPAVAAHRPGTGWPAMLSKSPARLSLRLGGVGLTARQHGAGLSD